MWRKGERQSNRRAPGPGPGPGPEPDPFAFPQPRGRSALFPVLTLVTIKLTAPTSEQGWKGSAWSGWRWQWKWD